MAVLLHLTELKSTFQNVHQENKSLVLVGGCFDILHIGHITFLENAKAQGDYLVVFLESDETITKMKGPKRPINTQHDRARILQSLAMVDAVVLLNPHLTNDDYDMLVEEIKPAIIATTAGDSNLIHKQRQAKKIGARVMEVTSEIRDQSTTRLFAILSEI